MAVSSVSGLFVGSMGAHNAVEIGNYEERIRCGVGRLRSTPLGFRTHVNTRQGALLVASAQMRMFP
jgi:hypothetical protein